MTGTAPPGLPDLAEVEAAVGRAIRRGSDPAVRVLGHGEISIVLAWPADGSPEHALKRVPPFRDMAAARTYIAACGAFFDVLTAAHVPAWPTTLHTTERSDGSVVVYHRQPVGDAACFGAAVLRAAEPTPDHPLLAAVLSHTQAVVQPGHVGFDVQAMNWLWDGTTAHQIDFTSPFTLNDTGDDLRFDTAGFLREYPAVLRPYLKRELLRVIQRYTRPEGAYGDFVANLLKEGLEPWVAPAIEAGRRVGVVVDRATATKFYEDDRKLMPLTLRLRKGQRWWLQHTGRRYDAMLPERTTYER